MLEFIMSNATFYEHKKKQQQHVTIRNTQNFQLLVEVGCFVDTVGTIYFCSHQILHYVLFSYKRRGINDEKRATNIRLFSDLTRNVCCSSN